MALKLQLDRKDNWRLDFHLQTPTGWLSDPNGLCQFNGVYHVFHQYSPRWPVDVHGWAHWISPDLINWEFCGGKIMPSVPDDANGSYSGSTVVRDSQMWCYYTGNVLDEGDYDYDYNGRHANEMLVISKDGRSFGEKRCVLRDTAHPVYCSNHVRDPKVWQQDGSWYMLLGARTTNDHGALLLFASKDGLDWKMAGSATNLSGKPFGYMWECPNMVRLSDPATQQTREFLFVCPQGVPKQAFRFQNIYNSGYFPIDGSVVDLMTGDTQLESATTPYPCIDETRFVELDYGFDFYAPQIFTDEQGRQILIAWVGLPDIDLQYDVPTREWSHTLTVPRELSLNTAGRVCQAPVAEIDGLRTRPHELTAAGAAGACGTIGSSSYDMFELEGACGASFATGTADLLFEGITGEGRLLLNDDLELLVSESLVELSFLGQAGRFRTVRRLRTSELSAGCVEKLRVLIDTSVVEIFVNDGELTLTTRWFPLERKLNVASTIPAAQSSAWEMGSFSFSHVG